MTEGRGPMLFNSAWSGDMCPHALEEWVNNQNGSMSNKSNLEDHSWSIEEVPLFHSLTEKIDHEIGEHIKTAMGKLTEAEIVELGLHVKFPTQFEELMAKVKIR